VVIGLGNVLKFSDNHNFFESVAEAIVEMQQLYINPIEEIPLNFGEETTVGLNDLFYNPNGSNVTVSLTNNSNPQSLTADVENNILSLTALGIIGYPTLTLHGVSNGLENDYNLKIRILDPDPITTSYVYEIGDSPEQEPFPYNTENPYYNTLLDLSWTSFIVTETGLLQSLNIDCMWRSFEHFETGALWLRSPSGLEHIIFQPEENGYTNIDFDLADFYAEPVPGEWQLYITDTEGNGGHEILGVEFEFEIIDDNNDVNSEVVSTNLDLIAYPNPFNPSTTISFSNTNSQELTQIEVYNLKGQKIKTLVNEKFPAGQHSVIWNGRDDNNKPASSGIYFYKYKSGEFQQTKKMILMK